MNDLQKLKTLVGEAAADSMETVEIRLYDEHKKEDLDIKVDIWYDMNRLEDEPVPEIVKLVLGQSFVLNGVSYKDGQVFPPELMFSAEIDSRLTKERPDLKDVKFNDIIFADYASSPAKKAKYIEAMEAMFGFLLQDEIDKNS